VPVPEKMALVSAYLHPLTYGQNCHLFGVSDCEDDGRPEPTHGLPLIGGNARCAKWRPTQERH